MAKDFNAMDAAEDFLRTMIDKIPTLAWSCRPDGNAEFLNQRWLDYTGLSPQEGLGWGWKTAIHPDDLNKLMPTWLDLLNSGEPGQEEARLRRFDGEYRWFLFRAVPVRDEQGALVRWYGTNADIEDLKRAQSLLSMEKRALEMITKGAPLSDILNDLCRMIDAKSPNSFSTILMVDADGQHLWPGAGPKAPDEWMQTIMPLRIGPAVGSCGTAAYLKKRIITSDISTDPLWADYRETALRYGVRASWSQPLISKQDELLGTFAICFSEPRNPTDSDLQLIEAAGHIALIAIERKRAGEALRESDERFRCMADTLPEVIWITALEPEEKALYVSPSFEHIWGLKVEDRYRSPRLWAENIHPDDRGRVIDTFKRWISGEDVSYQDIEFRIGQPDGAIRWIHERGVVSLNDQGKPSRVSGISTDITERKRAEEELRRSEAYLAEAQRLSLTGSFGWNVSGGELFWSKETFCILGYDPATKPTLGLLFQRVHPEDLTLVQRTIDRASRDGTDIDFEHRLLMPDGAVKHLKVVARAVKNERGQLVEFIGAVSDVTVAKQAEERIRQDEREFREIVEAIPQLITVLAPDGNILYVNKPVLEFTGLSMNDIQTGALRERSIHPDDRERLQEEIRRSLSHGKGFETEHRVLGKNGRYRWFLNRFNPFLDEKGHVIRWYVTGIDIDDRKQTEDRVQKENLALREEIDHSSMFEEIIGSSEALRKVLAQVTKVAPVDSTVLIMGETGTGKELIARAIHKRSKRSARAFIRVNCAAIPSSLIASELFGHEKGAFTGALQRRLGRFELADGGTIFLDEIGELPPETQIALLRVLQEREIERVGGSQPIFVDVRVLAATNCDLKAAVTTGKFREDLFYRLNVFPIQMPSLRDRVDDIPLLVQYFIERYGKTAGKKFRNINKKALELFQAYDWPGNIRELQNVIERAVILCDGDTFSIDETWLKREPRQLGGSAVPFGATLAEREREMIEAALTKSLGRVAGPTGAAAKLGIPRQTLEFKIKRLGIDKHRF
jgi:PAS domain S-box-containing protein